MRKPGLQILKGGYLGNDPRQVKTNVEPPMPLAGVTIETPNEAVKEGLEYLRRKVAEAGGMLPNIEFDNTVRTRTVHPSDRAVGEAHMLPPGTCLDCD